MEDLNKKAATLNLKLRADSSYEADCEYRISADQWGRILKICEEPEKPEAL